MTELLSLFMCLYCLHLHSQAQKRRLILNLREEFYILPVKFVSIFPHVLHLFHSCRLLDAEEEENSKGKSDRKRENLDALKKKKSSTVALVILTAAHKINRARFYCLRQLISSAMTHLHVTEEKRSNHFYALAVKEILTSL